MYKSRISYYFDTDSDAESYCPFSEHSGDPADDDLALNMNVGGLFYSLPQVVIKRHPDSYFARLLADRGRENETLVIDRDGKLFRHIQNFLNFDVTRFYLRPIDWLVSMRREASFYNLPKLVKICDKEIRTKLMRWGIHSLPSLNVLQPLNDDCVVKRVLLSHVHQSSVTSTVNTSGISSSFYSNLAKHKIKASKVERRRYFEPDSPEFYLGDSSSRSKIPLSSSDYHAVYTIMDAIPLLPNIFICVYDAVVMRITPGVSIDQMQMPQECVSKLGCAYCILQAAEAGGSITTTHDGITHTISRHGECVLFLQDGTFRLTPVTSGALVVLYCTLHRGARPDTLASCSAPADRENMVRERAPVQRIYPLVATNVCETLADALRHDLQRYSSVVVPLTRLYNFVSVDLDNLCLVTDPSVLVGVDAQLYECLRAHFEVTVVTVCSHRVGRVRSACVLGPVPVSPPMGPLYTVPALPAIETAPTTTATDTASATTSTTSASISTTTLPTTLPTTSTTTYDTTSTTTGVLIVSAARGYGKYGKASQDYQVEYAGVNLVAGLQISLKVDSVIV